MIYKYKTTGVCSRTIDLELDGGVVKNVKFEGGCSGNTQGIETLVRDMDADKVVALLKDIKCGFKDTSCPAQLAIALEKAMKQASDDGQEPQPQEKPPNQRTEGELT